MRIWICSLLLCGYAQWALAQDQPAPDVTGPAPEATTPPAETPPAAAPQETALRVEHVAGNVYMLEGKGGNIGVSVGPDGLLMVDDQFASESEQIQQALAALGKGTVKYVLNTHWHRDHTEGNQVFGLAAPVIAHTQVRKRLEVEKYVPEALPVITYENAVSVHFNGEEIRVIHVTDGHTDGDSIVYFVNSNVLHLGDQFFSGRLPFIDLDSGGSVEGYLENVSEILGQAPPDVLIIPGHGPLSTVTELKDFETMLTETIKLVQSQIRNGKKLDAIQEAGLPAPWSTWAWEFIDEDKYLEILFNGLTKGRRRTAPTAMPQVPAAQRPLKLIR